MYKYLFPNIGKRIDFNKLNMEYTIYNSKIFDIIPSCCILSAHPINILFSISTFLSKLFSNPVMINLSKYTKMFTNRFD